jgi:PAS domain S-box-containing protein
MSSPRILVVEDDAISGMYLKNTLEGFGYDVPYVATSLEDVMRVIPELLPDLVLMDIILRGTGDGIDAARSIASSHDVPVIYLTAYTDEEMIARARKTSPYGFLVKPVNISELHVAIEFALYRHFMESRLKQSEEKFRRLFEHSADAQLLIEDKKIFDCNKAAVQLFRAGSKDRLLGRTPDELSPEFQPDGTKSVPRTAEIFNFVHELESLSFEWVHLTFDGREVPVDITATVIPIGGKKIIHGVLKDITVRKLAQRARRRSEQQYRVLVETMSDGMVQADDDGNITFVNDRFCEMVGHTRKEIIGSPIAGFIDDDDREDFRKEAFVKKRDRKSPYEILLKTGDGKKVNAIVSLRHMTADRSTTPGIVAVFTDITDRKYLERQVLEISMNEQQRIGRDLHDDLGQILTGTGFLCESLTKKLSNKSLPETEEARAVSALINEAKDHTRLLSRGLSPVDVDSGGIANALERLAHGVESMYSVSCSLRCDADLDINDRIVETQFHYIVQESVNNAIKHGKAAHIDISLMKKKGQVHLVVKDDGIGIQLENDFLKGMGISIMRYRANAIGASITISKNREKGTIVSCVWRR